nr:hypothetical protein GCM10017745_37930 [Saccharothrix mutabilis subsp. capreolus]
MPRYTLPSVAVVAAHPPTVGVAAESGMVIVLVTRSVARSMTASLGLVSAVPV